ncbi:uncharacterized protein RHO25_013033 [Cercospora beticola]|nr:hypothetical protein RHO25_013033 [Cercospora beticola]
MLAPFEASRDPMGLSAHNYLIQPQYTRHLSNVSQPADLQGGDHASDPADGERPASMMLMYRDDLRQSPLKTNDDARNLVSSNSYHVKASDKDLEEAEVESIIHDIVTGPSSPDPTENNSRFWSSPSLPIDEAELWGHEQASMSATGAEEQTVYVPLTASRRPAAQRKDLGEGLDWNKILLRSRSESNLVFLKSRDRSRFCEKVLMLEGNREDAEKWREQGNIAELDLLWPPKAKILLGG